MHEKHVRRGGMAHPEKGTINVDAAASLPPGPSACPVGSDSCADSGVDQDRAEDGILFRPRLHFIPE